MKKNVLVLCHDTVGAKMAGPGIRYQNIAKQIKRVANVSLAVFSDATESRSDDILAIKRGNDAYQEVFDKFDVIFAQWLSLDMLKYAKANGKIVIIDLYAPVPIEYLASLGFSGKAIDPDKDLEFSGILETYQQYLTFGDFFVCSNERQRDFWLGFITSLNILKPSNFVAFQKMENIALCPMGISSTLPSPKSLQLRSKVGLKQTDFVLLWTGGIWDWFDSLTVITAIKKLNNPKVKLVFLGTQHPNSKVPEMSESKAARELAKKLNLTGKSVFFLDGWVDYDKRDSYLMDADVAIYADKDSVETRFSHRTRVLDHLWVGLPTICSKGDYLSTVLEDKNMGFIVGERTPEAFAAAINTLVTNPSMITEMKAAIKQEKANFTWEVLSTELINFIKDCQPKKPTHAAASATASATPNKTSPTLKRRVKNSIKVLLGRVDV